MLTKMDPKKIPQHIAIIMDGNGRWAKEKGLPRIAGHKEGAESVRAVLKAAADSGVKYLTLYAFSTENWKRPKEEVDFLMELFMQTINNEIEELMESRVRVQFLGRLQQFSPDLQANMQALRDCGVSKIQGYRAPIFSLTKSSSGFKISIKI